jgi:GMP synthase (glutamine-hydrolysing)
MMCRWTTRGHERMTLPNAQQRHQHFEGKLLHDDACRAWLSNFMDHWLKPKAAQAATPKGQRRGGSKVSTL